ncbi:MAG: hypothetical protein ACERIH_10445 [Labilibaculum antarcticum]
MKKVIIIYLICLFLGSCCQSEKKVRINQVSTSQMVFLNYSEKMNTVWAINVPFEIEIKNETSSRIKLVGHNYIYGNQRKGTFSKMYELIDTQLKEINLKTEGIDPLNSKQYIVYSKHFVDTSEYNNDYFRKEVEVLRIDDRKKIAVGSIEEFKLHYSKCSNSLYQKDSLKFSFYDADNDKFIKLKTSIK